MHRPIERDNPLILASDSPRRKKLLEQVRIPFRQRPSHAEESPVGGDPEREACAIAEAKASAVAPLEPGRWILGADTVVVMGEEIFGKPADEAEARLMLTRLAGRAHRVITGICIISPDGLNAHVESVITEVRFRPLAPQEVEDYIATSEPFGKAGAYAIQGIGAFMVEGITGPYTNVVGLPICALVKALLKVRAIEKFPLAAGKEP
jgi:septum formation protein